MPPRQGMLFVTPGLLVLATVIVVPLVVMVYLSLTSFQLGELWQSRGFVGLGNFRDILTGQDYRILPALLLSLRYVGVVVACSLVIGMAVGLLLTQGLRFSSTVTAFLLIPIVTSPPVVGLSWRQMLHAQNGVLNYYLGLLGLEPINWLGFDWAFTSLVIATLWHSVAFAAIVLSAGLQTVPKELYEAARVDGARPFESFLHITLPLMRPIILVTALLQSIDAVQQFGIVYTLTEGGPGGATQLLSLHAYDTALSLSGQIGRGATISIALTLLAVTFSALLMLLMRDRRKSGVGTVD